MLRIIAAILIILAGAKLAIGAYFYHASMHDLAVRAYRNPAVAGCAATSKLIGIGLDAIAWRDAREVRLEIGRRDADVQLWNTGHALWSQRYRDPYLYLVTGTGRDGITCTYDVLRGMATIKRD